VDLEARELRKSGLKIKLQDQPFQILAFLLRRPGEIITREELQQQLWPADTFVDFDRSLNTAVTKLREAMGDSATHPRYIETVARRGYRFVASVEPLAEVTAVATAPLTGSRRPGRRLVIALITVSLLATLGFVFSRWLRSPAPQVPVRKFSYSSGNNIFRPVISPDGRRIAYFAGETEPRLWIQDMDRDQPRELKGATGIDWVAGLFWSPSSNSLGFTGAHQMKRISVQGSPTTVICSLKSFTNWGASWSPDGNSVIFSSGSPARLYQVPAQGGEPRLVLPPEDSEKDLYFLYPHFLPPAAGGRRLLLSLARGERQPEITVVNLDSGRRETVGPGAWPVYSPTGHILYEYQVAGTCRSSKPHLDVELTLGNVSSAGSSVSARHPSTSDV
jgi:DNA-binding winged helix-turn-helix (wHTH) protein